MLRGCLAALALLTILVGVYFWWLDQVFEMPGSLVAAFIVGFIVFCCIGALQNSIRAFKDLSLAALARHGSTLRANRLAAISGKIQPIGEPLLAPFSGEECVICEYDLSSQHRPIDSATGKPNGVDYTGFLMTPSVIQTTGSEVRLLGYPMLEGFEEQRCMGYDSARNAIQFLTTAPFEDRTGLKMVTLFNVFGQVWSDDDGHVQKNIRIGKVKLTQLFPDALQEEIDRFTEWEEQNPEAALEAKRAMLSDEDEDEDEDLDDESLDEGGAGGISSDTTVPIMCEKRVRPGEAVLAIGIYDEVKMGLCPPPGSTTPTRLIKGTAEQFETRARKSLVSNLVGGLLFLVLANVGVYGAMQLYLHADSVAEKRTDEAFEAARRGNLDRLKQLARRKLSMNVRDDSGATLLMVADDPAVTQWLIDQGVDVNAADNAGMTALMYAARQNRVEIVKQLLAASADVNYVNPTTNRTALREADGPRTAEIADLLRQAGAKDDEVTAASGEPITGDGGEPLKAIKAYLEAMQQRDGPRLQQLISSDNGSNFDGDWEVWGNVHIAEVQAFEGFLRGDDATVRIFGRTGEGSPAFWKYQLRREGGQWKIVREEWVFN